MNEEYCKDALQKPYPLRVDPVIICGCGCQSARSQEQPLQPRSQKFRFQTLQTGSVFNNLYCTTYITSLLEDNYARIG